MVKYLIFLTVITMLCSCRPNSGRTGDNLSETLPAAGFDSLLAAKLGADAYGMGRFVMAFLKNGPNRLQDSVARAELQKAHMANISRMAEEGKLILAGPFLDNGELRGIYVFDVESLEEARALTETDPAVKAGSLIMELHPWYGSAALRKVNEIHESITR